MEYRIRRALISDRVVVYYLVAQLTTNTLDSDIFSDKYAENLRDPSIEYWLLELRDTIVGFVSIHRNNLLHHDLRVNEIQELVIDEAYRNRGMGRILVDFVISRFQNENLELASNKSRVDAKRFYKRLGFEATHNKFVYYAKNDSHN